MDRRRWGLRPCQTTIGMKRSWHLVLYDVRDDRRLRRVAKLLESYGDRVQLSVFRCRLTPRARAELLWKLGRIMDDVDSLMLVPLCDHCMAGVTQRGTYRVWPMAPPDYIVL